MPLFRHEMRRKKNDKKNNPRLKLDLHKIFAKLDRERTESPLKKNKYLSRHALISLKTEGPRHALTTQTHTSGHYSGKNRRIRNKLGHTRQDKNYVPLEFAAAGLGAPDRTGEEKRTCWYQIFFGNISRLHIYRGGEAAPPPANAGRRRRRRRRRDPTHFNCPT